MPGPVLNAGNSTVNRAGGLPALGARNGSMRPGVEVWVVRGCKALGGVSCPLGGVRGGREDYCYLPSIY